MGKSDIEKLALSSIKSMVKQREREVAERIPLWVKAWKKIANERRAREEKHEN